MVRSMALAATLAATLALPGYASTLSGSFNGIFAEPTGHTAATFSHTGGGTSSLAWGGPSGPNQTVEPGNSASLTVAGGNFTFAGVEPGNYLLGTITWVNQSNWHAGGTWSSALMLDLLVNGSGGPISQSVSINFSTYNSTDSTANTTLNEQTGLNPDEISGFVLSGGAFDLPIAIGLDRSLSNLSFRLLDAGSPGTEISYLFNGAPAGSEYDPATGFWQNREGGTSVIGVYGTVSSVPLPAGAWLLISGLAAVVVAGRRKSRTV